MKRIAKELKKGDLLEIGGEVLTVESLELSEIGKQGVQKCRIVARKQNKEKAVIIRPSDYPFEVK